MLGARATPNERTNVRRIIGDINGCEIVEEDDKTVTFTAGAAIDGDGANGQFGGPPCYAPDSYHGKILDVIANAGSPGNWFGVVTDTGKRDGTPIIQGAGDPCPGAYVSATSLHLPGKDGKADSGGVVEHIIQYRLFPGVVAVVEGVTYPLQHRSS